MRSLAEYGLTEKQELYVEHFVENGDGRKAAEVAGFSVEDEWRLRHTPKILHAISLRSAERLRNLVPIAMGALAHIAKNESAPASARVAASTAILDRAGFKPRSDDAPGGLMQELRELSTDDLEKLVFNLTAERAAAAKDVSAPQSTNHDAQVIDMLD